MTPSEGAVNLSGLEYFTIRDYASIVRRRKWLIVVTTFTLAILTAIVVHFLPNTYQATALIVVDRQKVPDYYVNSTVAANAGDRLDTLREQILSSARLAQVIDEMGLYKNLRQKDTQEEIIEIMREAIAVEVASSSHADRGVEAFTVSYSNSDPILAAQVTNRLASLLIEDNIKSREQSVMGTTDFLQRELLDAQQDLKAKEDEITKLKAKNVDVLPESVTTHVQALTSLQLELQNDRDTVNQDEQQKIYLESVLQNSPSVVNLDTNASPEAAGMEAQKDQLDNEMAQLRQRYGPSYPDVVKKSIQIRDLEKSIEEVEKREPPKTKSDAAPTKEVNPVIQSQIAKLDDDIQKRKDREQEIEKQITTEEAELARIPIFQQQISPVMRDYETAQEHYKVLSDRDFSANLAADLEIRQKGERFEILDPAHVPYKPSSPNRPVLNLIGLAAGLFLGFLGAFALEICDSSVKTEREVIGQLGAPVFGDVPWVATPAEHRRRVLHTVFACAGSATLVVLYGLLLFVTWT
jgi:polysaccharide biosynthesis transport protein